MEQNTEVYERIIDRIIKIHKDSLKEIFGVIKSLNLFSDAYLEKIISYIQIGKLYEIVCEDFPEFKYFNLNIGESNYLFHDDNFCNCEPDNLDEKIKCKNICKHLLTFKILFGINAYTQIHFNKDEMMQLIKESTNFIK